MEKAELAIRFTYHKPFGDQNKKYEEIRDAAHEFAFLIDDFVSDSREKSLAFTKLEEAVMWAMVAKYCAGDVVLARDVAIATGVWTPNGSTT